MSGTFTQCRMRLHGRPAKRPERLAFSRHVVAAAAVAWLLAVGSGEAWAGSYNVLACDAASEGSFIAHGWQAAASRGEAYVRCPTGDDALKGISNRIVGSVLPVPRDTYSVYQFAAPPGDTLSSIWWGGRAARGSCDWTTALISQPGSFVVTGTPANTRCGTTGFDLRHQPVSFPLAPGTTTIAQAIQCKAATQCTQGATFHTNWAVVTVNDPQDPVDPDRWGAGGGEVGQRRSSRCTSRPRTTPESHKLTSSSMASIPPQDEYPCSSVNARHCPTTPVERNDTAQHRRRQRRRPPARRHCH